MKSSHKPLRFCVQLMIGLRESTFSLKYLKPLGQLLKEWDRCPLPTKTILSNRKKTGIWSKWVCIEAYKFTTIEWQGGHRENKWLWIWWMQLQLSVSWRLPRWLFCWSVWEPSELQGPLWGYRAWDLVADQWKVGCICFSSRHWWYCGWCFKVSSGSPQPPFLHVVDVVVLSVKVVWVVSCSMFSTGKESKHQVLPLRSSWLWFV